jgi:hypothetical protein
VGSLRAFSDRQVRERMKIGGGLCVVCCKKYSVS